MRLRPFALFGAGLLIGVTVGVAQAAIPSATGVYTACYDAKGGTLHVVDSSVTTCPRGQIGPLTWSQTGPQGPAGTQGPAGPTGTQGPEGPQGSPGVIANLDSIDGLPCTRPGATGAVELVTDTYSGVGVIACVFSIGTPAVDAFSNSRLSPTDLAVACGGSRIVSGTTVPYGSSDWFKLSWTPTSTCPTVRIRFTTNPNSLARFDITDSDGVLLNGDGEHLNGSQLGTTVTGPSPLWIRVWAPYVGLGYTLAIDQS